VDTELTTVEEEIFFIYYIFNDVSGISDYKESIRRTNKGWETVQRGACSV
jgi:hypothetical protein